MIKIVLKQLGKNCRWKAYVDGYKIDVSFGDSAEEALGRLVSHKLSQLGIELVVKSFRPAQKEKA